MFRAAAEVGPDGSVVRMAGHLTLEFVRDVEILCLSAEPPILIDASELQDCDTDGLLFLARMREGTARVEGLSEYLRMRVRLVEGRHESSEPHE